MVVAAVADFARGGIAVVKLRVLGHPMVVPGSMVGDPIQNDLHSELVGLVHHTGKVGAVAKLGVDGAVVRDAVVGPEDAFALCDANGTHGHEPQDVGAQIFDARKFFFKAVQTAFGGELPHVDLIDHGVFRPVGVKGMDRFFGGLGGAGCGQQGGSGKGDKLLHGLLLIGFTSYWI